MCLETYIFIGGCRFWVGGFKLVHPFSASCFGGSVCAIGGSLPSKLPLYSDFKFQLSNFLIALASRSPQSKKTTSIAKKSPRVAPQTQERLSDPELTSLNLSRLLPISASSNNRTPHVAVMHVLALSCLSTLLLAASSARAFSNAHSRETPPTQTFLHLSDLDSAHRTLEHWKALWSFPIYAHAHGKYVAT